MVPFAVALNHEAIPDEHIYSSHPTNFYLRTNLDTLPLKEVANTCFAAGLCPIQILEGGLGPLWQIAHDHGSLAA